MLTYLDARHGMCYATGRVTLPGASGPFAFPGTTEEAQALCAAIAYWCKNGSDGLQCSGQVRCPAHEMLLDARLVNHLLFVRNTRNRWIVREFPPSPPIEP